MVPDSDAISDFKFPHSLAEIKIAIAYDERLKEKLKIFKASKDAFTDNPTEDTRTEYLENGETFKEITENVDRIVAHLKGTYKTEFETSKKYKANLEAQRLAQEAEVERMRASLQGPSTSSSSDTEILFTSNSKKRKTRSEDDPVGPSNSGDATSGDAEIEEEFGDTKRKKKTVPEVEAALGMYVL